MITTPLLVSCLISGSLSCAAQEHLEPIPLHNGEVETAANWGWYHPTTRNGSALEKTGSARIADPAADHGHDSEYFDGQVVLLEAGAAAVMGIEGWNRTPFPLVPGASYEISWSQGCLGHDPPPTVTAYILDKTLEEVPGTRIERTTHGDSGGGWARQRGRIAIPVDFNPEHGQMIAFQNTVEARSPSDSVALVDKVTIARVVEDDARFTPLFDGRTLDGWMGAVKGYKAVDGALEMDLESRGAGNIYTEGVYGDFILRFEFKLTPGANNGIGIRTPPGGDAAYKGMEIQVLENSHPKYAGLKPWQFHGSIYGVAPAARGYQRPPGEWNTEEIRANGRQVTVTLNGQVIADVDLDEATKEGTLSGREHPGLTRKEGHIALCFHGDEVAFRNIRIMPIDGPAGATE